MKMHFRRVHSENISCGICNLEVKDIETLDIHTFTCERFQCNWCAKSFNNVSDMKIHGKKNTKEEVPFIITSKRESMKNFSLRLLFPSKIWYKIRSWTHF